MRNKIQKIKNIFLKRMSYSLIMQVFMISFLIILIKHYIIHNANNIIANDLFIKDQYTIDQIINYEILGNKYALNLELHNLGDMNKLDSIKFTQGIEKEITPNSCEKFNYDNLILCKSSSNTYIGISTITYENKILGYIVATKKYSELPTPPSIGDSLLILLTTIGSFIFNFVFLFLSMKKNIETNTKLLLKFISSEKESKIFMKKIYIEEYITVAKKFIIEKKEIEKLQKEKAYYEAKKLISEQVAHDIRSPLAAINTAISDISSIPENQRIMIKNASTRINDIANHLLEQSKNHVRTLNNNIQRIDKKCPELMLVVLDNIIAEKKYEYNSRVNIQLNIQPSAYNCFANINLSSFKRVLSNLINNSIEAIKSNGLVTISLACNKHYIEVIIEDNGCGIPNDILCKIAEHGFSYNKKDGNGLGLFYAKQYIEQINGKLLIQSNLNRGTKVTLSFPPSKIPAWFCETIYVKKNSTILILDDDYSMHNAWKERFSNIFHINIVNFYHTSDLLTYPINTGNEILFLINYELFLEHKNDLSAIEDLAMNNKIFLVTNCLEDSTLRNQCEKLTIKIVPKSHVRYIPILESSNPSSLKNVVLIDDDEMMRAAWEFSAKAAGAMIKTYASFNNFMQDIKEFDKKINIYIDSELGDSVKGEVHAKTLFDLGFTEIHLATGHPHHLFTDMPWIKSIARKDPPFN